MKVTLCSYDGKGYFGGPYEWVKRFGPALREKGIEVNFLFLSDHQANYSSTYLYLKELGFNCKLLPVHSLSQYHDNTEDRVRWVLKHVKKNPPDIFIANSVLPALYAGRWIKEAGIPVVGVSHTDDAQYQWLLDLFLHDSKEYALDAMVCVSHLLKQKSETLRRFNTLLEIISCGTPVLKELPLKDRAVLKIVYAGKLTEEAKQISLLTQAFCKLVNSVEGVEAYIYGDGPAKEQVLSIIRQEDKEHKVHYKGFVSSADIQTEIADKDVVVLLSDYEGLPIILLEAMACGLVPVCLNIRSGIPELVKDLETGILVNNREQDFCNHIIKLKDSPELWGKLSHNARSFVMKEHAMEVVVQKWINLFNKLKSESTKEVKIPLLIDLPPVHSNVIGIDNRKTSFIEYLQMQVKRFFKKLIS